MSEFTILTDRATYEEMKRRPLGDELWRNLDRALLRAGGDSYTLGWTDQPTLPLTERADG